MSLFNLKEKWELETIVSRFRKALVSVAKKVKQKPDMSEGSIYHCFAEAGFSRCLGYTAPGIDIKAQEKIGKKIADYECIDDIEQSIFILEIKEPTDEEKNRHR